MLLFVFNTILFGLLSRLLLFVAGLFGGLVVISVVVRYMLSYIRIQWLLLLTFRLLLIILLLFSMLLPVSMLLVLVIVALLLMLTWPTLLLLHFLDLLFDIVVYVDCVGVIVAADCNDSYVTCVVIDVCAAICVSHVNVVHVG